MNDKSELIMNYKFVLGIQSVGYLVHLLYNWLNKYYFHCIVGRFGFIFYSRLFPPYWRTTIVLSSHNPQRNITNISGCSNGDIAICASYFPALILTGFCVHPGKLIFPFGQH
ncbi:hypothetical protein BH20BAC1_BH20BAC1_14610 [soil metagenome]